MYNETYQFNTTITTTVITTVANGETTKVTTTVETNGTPAETKQALPLEKADKIPAPVSNGGPSLVKSVANTPTNAPTKIQSILEVPEEYAFQCFNMAQEMEDAVEMIDGVPRFNFGKAIDIVKKDHTMAITGITDTEIDQTDAQVTVMVDKVLELLKKVIEIALSDEEILSLRTSVENTFTNLAQKKDSAWIFWQHEDAHKTTYQYNIFFGIKNAKTGAFIMGVPLSLTIEVDIEKEQVLFVTLKDIHKYSVKVQSLRIIQIANSTNNK